MRIFSSSSEVLRTASVARSFSGGVPGGLRLGVLWLKVSAVAIVLCFVNKREPGSGGHGV
jgi:hypothetical protein